MMGTSVSEQVVQAVANKSNTDALDLPPLFDTLDPDSLDTLIQEMNKGEVAFDYAGQHITVNSRGEVVITEMSTNKSTAGQGADD